MAVVLLAGAGLLAKSFYLLLHVETGFDTSHLATVYVMAPDNVYGKPEQQIALYHQILEKVSAMPGVQSAASPAICRCSAIAIPTGYEFPANRFMASTMRCCNET